MQVVDSLALRREPARPAGDDRRAADGRRGHPAPADRGHPRASPATGSTRSRGADRPRTQRDRRRHHPGDRARPGPAAPQPGRGRPDTAVQRLRRPRARSPATEPVDAKELVSLLLDGVLIRRTTTPETPRADPPAPQPPSPVPGATSPWSCCSSSSRPSRRSTCPRSTPTSSTTACVTGDTGYIMRIGGVHARRSRWCRSSCADRGRLLRRPDRDGARPRRPRRRSSPGCRRSPPARSASSARPSLITRTTNDVQQVQMLVADDVHADGVGADHVRRRHHPGAAPGRAAVRAAAGRSCRCWSSSVGADHRADAAAVPADAGAHRRASTGCCASRSPASG